MPGLVSDIFLNNSEFPEYIIQFDYAPDSTTYQICIFAVATPLTSGAEAAAIAAIKSGLTANSDFGGVGATKYVPTGTSL